MRKVFILTQFGSPHSWTEQFINHVSTLEKDGWYFKIFTPNREYSNTGNVEFIPMTIEEFSDLVAKTCGVHPSNYLKDGIPSKAMSDFYIASGLIFQDYIKGFDYWGITNWDIVYGNLSKFIPDSEIAKYDIWSDDMNTINGIFCLFKNEPYINSLFTEIPNWQNMFRTHTLYGTDEYHMTEVVRKASQEGRIKFGYPKYFPLHSHDRLDNHVPEVRLERKEDGSLWELFYDTAPPNWQHARPTMGKEVAYFHFIRTKKWPDIA